MSGHDARQQNSGWARETQRVTVRVPDDLLEEYEALVDDEVYPNRSAAIRAAMRDYTEGEDGS